MVAIEELHLLLEKVPLREKHVLVQFQIKKGYAELITIDFFDFSTWKLNEIMG